MSTSARHLRFLHFGVFDLDLTSGELCKYGTRIRLQEQPFQILKLLLERPGEVVTREELRQKLWPADTFVDFNHGLHNAVNRLRETLGDSADSPKFIETVPRRGYRLIAPVEEIRSATEPVEMTVIPGGLAANVAPKPDSTVADVQGQSIEAADACGPVRMQVGGEDADISAVPNSGRRWRFRPLFWAVAIAAVLTQLVVFALHSSHVLPATRSFLLPPPGATFNLTGDDGGSLVLSPDGTKLAFVAVNSQGDAQVWVRPLSRLSADAIAGTEGATYPFWSPDGNSIGFFAQGKLKKISLAGGAPTLLCDAPFGRGGSWNQNGIIIFAPESHTAIYRVSDSGGKPEPVTVVNTAVHTTHRWPKFLPDGIHFLYLAATHTESDSNGRSGSNNAVYLGSIERQQSKLLIGTDADATFALGYLFFLQKDTLMAQPFDPNTGELRGQAMPTVEKVLYDPSTWKVVFDASDGVMAYETGAYVAGTQYRWYEPSGREIGLLGKPEYHSDPRFSPDGKKFAESIGATDGEIWVHDLPRDLRYRVTFDVGQNNSPVWSRDGSRLFISSKTQHYSLYELDASGATAKHLVLDTGNDIWPRDLSSDGRFLIYAEGLFIGRARSKLWVYPTAGGQPFRLLKGDALEEDGQFSPDGAWVAYTSNESGRKEVYVGEFVPGIAGDQDRVAIRIHWQVSPSGGHWPKWRRDGKELFYISMDNTVMAVPISTKSSKLQIGAAHPLFHTNPDPTNFPYDVTLDGRRFLINTSAAEKTAPITLVENWFADLHPH